MRNPFGERRRQLEQLKRRVVKLSDRQDARFEELLTEVRGVGESQRQQTAMQNRYAGGARRLPLAFGSDEFQTLADGVQLSGRTLLGPDRLYVLWQAARNVAPLGLPAIEVGTYRGGSAHFLAAALRYHAGEARAFHVFDTFSGHAAADITDAEPHHQPGRFGEADVKDVRAYLAPFDHVHLHVARFPVDGVEHVPELVGFAHVDVDLELPTSATLALLRDRMPPGGVIVVDDFGGGKTPGIRRAVDAFLEAGPPFSAWDVDTEQVVLVRR